MIPKKLATVGMANWPLKYYEAAKITVMGSPDLQQKIKLLIRAKKRSKARSLIIKRYNRNEHFAQGLLA